MKELQKKFIKNKKGEVPVIVVIIAIAVIIIGSYYVMDPSLTILGAGEIILSQDNLNGGSLTLPKYTLIIQKFIAPETCLISKIQLYIDLGCKSRTDNNIIVGFSDFGLSSVSDLNDWIAYKSYSLENSGWNTFDGFDGVQIYQDETYYISLRIPNSAHSDVYHNIKKGQSHDLGGSYVLPDDFIGPPFQHDDIAFKLYKEVWDQPGGDTPSEKYDLIVNTEPGYCTVEVNGLESVSYVETKNSGSSSATFYDIDSGSYYVAVSKQGYATEWQTASVDSDKTIDFYLTQIDNNNDDYKVKISVLAADTGKPLGGVEVYLDEEKRYTDSQGQVIFNNVVKGDYVCRFQKYGYGSKSLSGSVNCDVDIRVELEPTSGIPGFEFATLFISFLIVTIFLHFNSAKKR